MSSSSSPLEAIRLDGVLRGLASRPLPAPASRPCIVLALAALVVLFTMLALSRPAAAEPIRGEATLTTSGGYGRLLLHFPRAIEAQVRTAGNILIVQFSEPVAIDIGSILSGARDFVTAARRDPDGRGLRLALARSLRVNTIDAGERFYIDLLPPNWAGPLPSLPQEIVEELARRTREAERVASEREARLATRQKAPVRVRVSRQPTFIRYSFDLDAGTGVSTDRAPQRLTLVIAAPMRLDLADARLSLPTVVSHLDSESGAETTTIVFDFSAPVDLRTFREDGRYMIDVMPLDADAKAVGAKAVDAAAKAPRAASKPPLRLAGLDGMAALLKADAADRASPATTANTKRLPPRVAAPRTVSAAMPRVRDEPVEAPIPPIAVPSAAPAPVSAPEPKREATSVASSDEAAKASNPGTSETTTDIESVQTQASEAQAARPDGAGAVPVLAATHGDVLRLSFPFRRPTPAAVFIRGDMLWTVFDTHAELDLSALRHIADGGIREAQVAREGVAQVIRVRLDRPRTARLARDGNRWIVTLSDTGGAPDRSIAVSRTMGEPANQSARFSFEETQRIHWIRDPALGDTLMVATGLGPVRGLPRSQSFLEFVALMSAHGVVVQRIADDLTARIDGDAIRIGRPRGLSLSGRVQRSQRATEGPAPSIDVQTWGFDRQAEFAARRSQLEAAAAAAVGERRTAKRLDLARFFLSRDLYAEAKAVLDVAIADQSAAGGDPAPLVLRAMANLMLGREDLALADLDKPLLAGQSEALLLRGVARSRQGRFQEAIRAFDDNAAALAALPVEWQRAILFEQLHATVETGALADAANRLAEFETIGIPPGFQGPVAVLSGRLHETRDRDPEALASYQMAVDSPDLRAAAAGRLRQLALRYERGDLSRPRLVADLENLTTIWRGDETEAEALNLLARLYNEEERYRDAFHVMRAALSAHPDSELTRTIQVGASATFDTLFLSGKADTLPAIEALALFYDFRELMPIGRRGDEMIRRMADRLVSVDLLDKAAELLQHQIEHRLKGAARAQVAVRLAMIYLMAREPQRAQAALRSTSVSNLSNIVRRQRILIEARALSDIGRDKLAIEAIEAVDGPEAIRLRADIHWAARRWQDAAEQIELLYGDRWRAFEPLDETERADILRAAVGFVLAEDTLGLSRLRERYEPKMTDTPDGAAFATVAAGLGSDSAEFRAIARAIARVDTLKGFMRAMNRGMARGPSSSAAL